MNGLLRILALCLVLCVAFSYGIPAEAPKTYTTQFDDIDLDEILKSKRLLASYIKCVNEGTGCTAQGKQLRLLLPDALQTNCSKCSEKQRSGAIKVIKVLEKDHPEDWNKLLNKWDPDRKLFEAFKKQYKDLYHEIFEHPKENKSDKTKH